jgi:cold shock CspA family protein
MGRSQESFNKKEVRSKKEKKRKEKEKKRLARKENEKKSSLEDMVAYVDENGNITSEPPDPGKKRSIDIDEIEISPPKKEPASMDQSIRKGKIIFYNESKGYGFIKDIDNQKDIFVHNNNLIEEVSEGDTVIFEIGEGPKGPTAINVKQSISTDPSS